MDDVKRWLAMPDDAPDYERFVISCARCVAAMACAAILALYF